MNIRRGPPSASAVREAFTLIEVLVVLSIIAILASMAMPILTVAQRAAKRSATESVMRKCDTALKLFRLETGTYPFQRNYADVDANERPDNRLYFHLGTTLSSGDQLKLQADADTAAAQYAYDCTPASGTGDAVEPTGAPKLGAHAFRRSDVKPGTRMAAWSKNGTWPWELQGAFNDTRAQMATALVLNRMGRERARRAVHAGNVDMMGCRMANSYHPLGTLYATGRDLSGSKILATAQTDAKPGWASDYLAGELERRYIDGEAVLDANKRPLVYVCQVVEGMRSSGGLIFDAAAVQLNSRDFGLARQGRRSLAVRDPITGADLAADGAALPDPANRMHSDRRIYAPPKMEHEFELWSVGGDGRLGWMRDDPRNTDNIPLLPYDKGLQ